MEIWKDYKEFMGNEGPRLMRTSFASSLDQQHKDEFEDLFESLDDMGSEKKAAAMMGRLAERAAMKQGLEAADLCDDLDESTYVFLQSDERGGFSALTCGSIACGHGGAGPHHGADGVCGC